MRHQNPPFIPFEQNIMPPTFYTKKCTQKIPLSERLALFYSKTGFGDYHYLYWFDNYNLQHIINSKWYFENKVQRNNSTLPNIGSNFLHWYFEEKCWFVLTTTLVCHVFEKNPKCFDFWPHTITLFKVIPVSKLRQISRQYFMISQQQ